MTAASTTLTKGQGMRPYLITTGILFAVIAVAHGWEVIDRSRVLASDILVFAASIGLSVWAWRLWRLSRSS